MGRAAVYISGRDQEAVEDAAAWVRALVPENHYPKTGSCNPRRKPPNLHPGTRNPEFETQIPEPRTPNPAAWVVPETQDPETQNSKPRNPDLET